VAAQSLAGHDITYLATSPLERAQQTAEPFAAQFKLPVTVDDRLIEAFTRFDGARFTGRQTLRHPRTWWSLRAPVTPSWGEPYREIAERMYAALLAAREAAEGHEALCVSHQLPIWTLRRWVERKRLWHDPRRRRCGLASLTSFHFTDDRVIGIGYAEPAGHLAAQSPTFRTTRGA
jgi:broad specificity phosphatase PhoE